MRRKRDGDEMNGQEDEWRDRVIEKKRNGAKEERKGTGTERRKKRKGSGEEEE